MSQRVVKNWVTPKIKRKAFEINWRENASLEREKERKTFLLCLWQMFDDGGPGRRRIKIACLPCGWDDVRKQRQAIIRDIRVRGKQREACGRRRSAEWKWRRKHRACCVCVTLSHLHRMWCICVTVSHLHRMWCICVTVSHAGFGEFMLLCHTYTECGVFVLLCHTYTECGVFVLLCHTYTECDVFVSLCHTQDLVNLCYCVTHGVWSICVTVSHLHRV
jgi:hypothetical protein